MTKSSILTSPENMMSEFLIIISLTSSKIVLRSFRYFISIFLFGKAFSNISLPFYCKTLPLSNAISSYPYAENVLLIYFMETCTVSACMEEVEKIL